MRTRSCLTIFALALALLISGCSASANPAAIPVVTPAPPPPPPPPPPATGPSTVFTMSNSTTGNAVLAFARQPDGSLGAIGSFSTGGAGTGGGLQNQGALTFTTDKQFLLVVNAASNDFSVLRIGPSGLTLVSRTASGGAHPISIAEHSGLVYLLNLGSSSGPAGADSISGFRIDAAGQATPIANSTRTLSTFSTRAAQIGFSPGGNLLLVTERGTAVIDAFPIDSAGIPSVQPVLNQSVGTIPFGFQFLDATHVLVSEEGPNATSSYTVSQDGTLSPISRSVPSFQGAVCWLAISPNLRFAFTGNTTGASVSGYAIRPDASVALLVPSGLSAATDGGALDITVSGDSRYLYAILTNGTLETFALDANGGLSKVQSLPSLGSINGVISF